MSLSVITDTFSEEHLSSAVESLNEYGVAVTETSYERAGSIAKRHKARQIRGGREVESNAGDGRSK